MELDFQKDAGKDDMAEYVMLMKLLNLTKGFYDDPDNQKAFEAWKEKNYEYNNNNSSADSGES